MLKCLRILMVIIFSFLSIQASAEATATTTTAASTSGIPSLGIPECDAFLAKYAECVNKLSPELKAVLETAMQSTAEGWQKMLKDVPQDVILKSCQATHESMKTTMASYHCSW